MCPSVISDRDLEIVKLLRDCYKKKWNFLKHSLTKKKTSKLQKKEKIWHWGPLSDFFFMFNLFTTFETNFPYWKDNCSLLDIVCLLNNLHLFETKYYKAEGWGWNCHKGPTNRVSSRILIHLRDTFSETISIYLSRVKFPFSF